MPLWLALSLVTVRTSAQQESQNGNTAQAMTRPALLQAPPPVPGACSFSGSMTTLVSLTVTAEGLPTNEAVRGSSGNDCLDQQALKTVNQYKFRAARRAGQPVATAINIEVNFKKF